MRGTKIISTLLVLLTLTAASLDAFAQSVRIESPTADQTVETPFLVEGRAEPGAVLQLLLDGKFAHVFRADSNGAFSVAIDRDVEKVTVRTADASDESFGSATVVIAGTVGSGRVAPPQGARSARSRRAVGGPQHRDDLYEETLRLDAATDEEPARRTWEPFHTNTMLTQLPTGLVGGLAGGVGGFLLFPPTARATPGAGDVSHNALPTLVAVATGVTAGTWLTVQGVGALWGGKSPFWASLLGAMAGTAISVALPPGVFFLPTTFSTLAYHLAAQ